MHDDDVAVLTNEEKLPLANASDFTAREPGIARSLAEICALRAPFEIRDTLISLPVRPTYNPRLLHKSSEPGG